MRKSRIEIRLSDYERTVLKESAKSLDVTISEFIRQAIKDFVLKVKRKEKS